MSTHEVCECVCSGVMVLMLELLCLKGLSVDVGGVGSAAPSSQPLDGGWWKPCLCCCSCCPNPETVGIVFGGVVPTPEQ